MYVTEHPIRFSDLTKAVQRSAGLGQVTCPDGSTAPDALSCLPVETLPAGGGLLPVAAGTASAAESPYYINILGLQIPTTYAVIGGILIAGLLIGSMGGRRR